MQTASFKDIGLVEYKEAWDYQEKIFNKILKIKSKTEMKVQILKPKTI